MRTLIKTIASLLVRALLSSGMSHDEVVSFFVGIVDHEWPQYDDTGVSAPEPIDNERTGVHRTDD